MRVYLPYTMFNHETHDTKFAMLEFVNPETHEYDRLIEQNYVIDFIRYNPIQNAEWVIPTFSRLVNPEGILVDVFFAGDRILTFNKKAIDHLKEILYKNGNLLPIKIASSEKTATDAGYQMYMTTTIVDAINVNGTVLDRPKEENSGFKIYNFLPEKLTNVSIFRLPPNKNGGRIYYVTDLFKEAFEKSGLTGMCFALIWDSENPDYHDERYDLDQWQWIKKDYKRSLTPIPLPRGWKTYDEASVHVEAMRHGYGMMNPEIEREPTQQEWQAILNGYDQMFKAIKKAEKLKLTGNERPSFMMPLISRVVDQTRNNQDFTPDQRDNLIQGIAAFYSFTLRKAYVWRYGVFEDKHTATLALIEPNSSLWIEPISFIQKYFDDPRIENNLLEFFEKLHDPQKNGIPEIPGSYTQLT